MADNILSLSGKQFENLLKSANEAYKVLTEFGPFYGQEHIKEPTFRVTAQPVKLPKGSKNTLEQLGLDLLNLAHTLQKLPKELKEQLSKDLDFSVPIMWRVDAIIDKKGNLKINEIEGQDGASALMIAEQLAYKLQKLHHTTAASLAKGLKKLHKASKINVAFIRVDNPHNANANSFVKMVHQISGGSVILDHIFDTSLKEGKVKPKWHKYHSVISESSLAKADLLKLGVKEEQILTTGNYNALVNKGVFALIHDENLSDFWKNQLGTKTYTRLKKILIKSSFVSSELQIETAKKNGQVVKTSWAGKNTSLINRSRGVALPVGNVEQSSDDMWNFLKELVKQDVKLIAQEFVEPAKIKAFLRKKSTNLEPVEWYNRVCAKYVVEGPVVSGQKVKLTAIEVTLGPEVIPAGRKCAFTAGTF